MMWIIILFISTFYISTINSTAHARDLKNGLIPVKLAADFIHAAIEADRTIYSEYIVERLGNTIALKATENWKEDDTLLLPAQFLSLASQTSNAKHIGMNYRLMSLWPINKNNSPKTKFEKIGLKKILKDPSKPHTGIIEIKGKLFFQAVYPDLAVAKSCANCHNYHPKSPKKDFKLGDVMGGVIINIPLGKSGLKTLKGEVSIPPEVAADYVHSVLESDRTVYAKYIVNRLQNKKILYASENWWEEDVLLLPAQFLLSASDLIKNRNLGLDFRLISLWPINTQNGPANEFERKGLESVVKQPLRPYIGSIALGEKKYFQAIYPDLAVTKACVICHNDHPKSPKKDFKLFDVMGGIVVTLPTN